MKLLKLLTFLIIILATSCSKEKEKELIEPETTVEINLISPTNSIVDNFNIDFIWETNSDKNPRFLFDSEGSFTNPIIDTVLNSSTISFNFNKLLAPNSSFYWKINIDSTDSSLATFKTEDIISQYAGLYEMVVRESYEDDDGFFDYDTTYITNLELIVLDNKIQLDANHGFSGEILSFRADQLMENTLGYEHIISPWHHEVYLDIPLNNDTIRAFKTTGGLGSHTDWSMRGVKIE